MLRMTTVISRSSFQSLQYSLIGKTLIIESYIAYCSGTTINTETSRLDDDAPDDEEDGQRRRKRPKKTVVKDNNDQSGTYQLHPLKVILFIYDDDDDDSEAKPSKLITLRFEYLVKLNVICVGIEDAEEGDDYNILCNLFPDDTGLELPHQVNIFCLEFMLDLLASCLPKMYHLSSLPTLKLTSSIMELICMSMT